MLGLHPPKSEWQIGLRLNIGLSKKYCSVGELLEWLVTRFHFAKQKPSPQYARLRVGTRNSTSASGANLFSLDGHPSRNTSDTDQFALKDAEFAGSDWYYLMLDLLF